MGVPPSGVQGAALAEAYLTDFSHRLALAGTRYAQNREMG